MIKAVVTAPAAPLYAEPKPGAERTDEALFGMEAEVLERQGEFRRIRTAYGYEGCALGKDLCEDAAKVIAWQAAPKLTVRQAWMDIQEEPRVRSPVLCSVPRSALVSPSGEPTAEGWREVHTPNGQKGWCWNGFLMEYHPPMGYGTPLPAFSQQEEASLRRAIVDTALSYYGTQYRWGGKTPLGLDCSGLCSVAYLLNGVTIWRDAEMAENYPVHPIPLRDAKPGDLLYFPGHMAMLIGYGRYVHATAGGGDHGVVINSLEPGAPDYRTDLPGKLLAVGSIFGSA